MSLSIAVGTKCHKEFKFSYDYFDGDYEYAKRWVKGLHRLIGVNRKGVIVLQRDLLIFLQNCFYVNFGRNSLKKVARSRATLGEEYLKIVLQETAQ